MDDFPKLPAYGATPEMLIEAINTLHAHTVDLREKLKALTTGGQLQQVDQVRVAQEVSDYTVVYYDPSSRMYRPAIAQEYNRGVQGQAAMRVNGIIVNVANGKGDLVYSGVLPAKDLAHPANSLSARALEPGENWSPGAVYYLSPRVPGRITRFPAGWRVVVGRATDEHFLVSLNVQQPYPAQNYTKVPLSTRPAGGLRVIDAGPTFIRVVGYDGIEWSGDDWVLTQESADPVIRAEGWLQADLTWLSRQPEPVSGWLAVWHPGHGNTIFYRQAETLGALNAAIEAGGNDVWSSGVPISDPTFSIPVRGTRGDLAGYMESALVSENNDKPRLCLFQLPDDLIGWTQINQGPVNEEAPELCTTRGGVRITNKPLGDLSEVPSWTALDAPVPLVEKSNATRNLAMVEILDPVIGGPNGILEGAGMLFGTGSVDLPVVAKIDDRYLIVDIEVLATNDWDDFAQSAGGYQVKPYTGAAAINVLTSRLATPYTPLKAWRVVETDTRLPDSLGYGDELVVYRTTTGELYQPELFSNTRLWNILHNRYIVLPVTPHKTPYPANLTVQIRQRPQYAYTAGSDRTFAINWPRYAPGGLSIQYNGVELESAYPRENIHAADVPAVTLGSDTLYWNPHHVVPWDDGYSALYKPDYISPNQLYATHDTSAAVPAAAVWTKDHPERMSQMFLYLNHLGRAMTPGLVRDIEVTPPLTLTHIAADGVPTNQPGSGYLRLGLHGLQQVVVSVPFDMLGKQTLSFSRPVNLSSEKLFVPQTLVLAITSVSGFWEESPVYAITWTQDGGDKFVFGPFDLVGRGSEKNTLYKESLDTAKGLQGRTYFTVNLLQAAVFKDPGNAHLQGTLSVVGIYV